MPKGNSEVCPSFFTCVWFFQTISLFFSANFLAIFWPYQCACPLPPPLVFQPFSQFSSSSIIHFPSPGKISYCWGYFFSQFLAIFLAIFVFSRVSLRHFSLVLGPLLPPLIFQPFFQFRLCHGSSEEKGCVKTDVDLNCPHLLIASAGTTALTITESSLLRLSRLVHRK